MQKPMTPHFSRAPYVAYKRGEDKGLLGFDKPLSDEDIEFVKTTLPTINDKTVEWSLCSGKECYFICHLLTMNHRGG